MTKDEALKLALEALEKCDSALAEELAAWDYEPTCKQSLQVSDEPVAWMWQHDETGRIGFVDPWQVENGWQANNPRCKLVHPLYTRPQPAAQWVEVECPLCGEMAVANTHPVLNKPAAWVGLTDEEIEQGCKESWVTLQAWQSAVWWAEAKLKEKNT